MDDVEGLGLRLDELVAALARALAASDPPLEGWVPHPLGKVEVPPAAGLPVLRWLDVLARQAPPPAAEVVALTAALAPQLRWRQTYGRDEADAPFLDNYGWVELIGHGGLRRRTDTSIGLLVLGAETLYPHHHHPAVERYVPLSGTAQWFDEDRGWRPIAPLQTILHRANVAHAMRTTDEPLLAFFHWSGEGVAERARFN
jgi:mannose-6-phosphate isomerase-like protein (cupin superfamily)